MTTAAGMFPVLGVQPVGNFGNTTDGGLSVEVATAASGYVPKTAVGSTMLVVDPYWGQQELIRLKVPTSTALSVGTIVTWDNTFSVTAVPNTANLGQPVAFILNNVVSNATVPQYVWGVVGGACVALCGASVAANTAYGITAAGKGGAIANGKQIVNSRVQVAASTTVVKANTLVTSGCRRLVRGSAH
jgi:hypothetical protein